MLTTQNVVAIVAVFISLGTVACAWFRDRGYKSGISDGYEQGRKDADDWWIGTESEIDQARRELWKKGAKR